MYWLSTSFMWHMGGNAYDSGILGAAIEQGGNDSSRPCH
jgi:hypothetical protein